MAEIYTPTYGNTTQGQQLQSGSDIMSSITGTPPSGGDLSTAAYSLASQVPNALQATQQQLTQESGIPQLQQGQMDLGKIFQLYLSDHNLSQQYSQPVTPQTPTAQDYINLAKNPQSAQYADTSKGFTTPSVVTSAMGEVPSSAAKLINSLTDMISAQRTNVKDYTGLASKNYQAAIDALLGLSDRSWKQKEYGLKEREQNLKEFQAGYNPGGTSIKTAEDYTDEFMGGYRKWADIPSSMKTAVTKSVKARGGKVETIIEGFKVIDDGIKTADDILGKWKGMSEGEKRLPNALVELVPGLSPSRAKINAIFWSTLEPSLRKSIISGRITQQEINWIKGAFMPQSLDTVESAQAKLEAFKYGLGQKVKNPAYTIGDESLQEYKAGAGGSTNSGNQKSGKYTIVGVQ